MNVDLDSISGQLDAIRTRHVVLATRLEELQTGFQDLKQGQKSMLAELGQNTAVTTEIKEILTVGKIGSQFIKWASIVIGSLAAIWAAGYSVFHPK